MLFLIHMVANQKKKCWIVPRDVTSIISTLTLNKYLNLAVVHSLHRKQPSSTDSSMALTMMKRDVQ